MANISKKLNITLDTIEQKPIRVRNFVAVIGDSIEITLNIMEKGLPKNIEGCTCRLVGDKGDGEYFEQIENIEVLDELNGIIRIKPSTNVFNKEGQVISCPIIEDEDEIIHLQNFIIEVKGSTFTDIINSEEENISSLRELKELLGKHKNDLDNISTIIADIEADVENNLEEARSNLEVLISDTNDKLNNLDETIDYTLIKNIKLENFIIPDSNYISMKTNKLNVTGEELLSKAYDVFIGGKLQDETYNTCLGKLTFYKQGGKIYPYFMSISNRTVLNRSLSISIFFNDNLLELSPSDKDFFICIRTNISKDILNSNAICVLTPLGIQ